MQNHPPPPPPAPMPPPPGGLNPGMNQMPGPIPVFDDFGGAAQGPPMVDFVGDDFSNQPKPKKQKGAQVKVYQPVDVAHEGYLLERVAAPNNGKLSWGRVSKSSLPCDERKLADLAKKHRQVSKSDPVTEYSQLSSKQRGVVDQLIKKRQMQEQHPNADWILLDILKRGIPHYTRPMEVQKLQVILRRQDRTLTKPNTKTARTATTDSQAIEIIDVNEPLIEFKSDKNLGQTGNKKKQPKKPVNASDDFLDAENPMAINRQPPGPPPMLNFAPPPVQQPPMMVPPGSIPAPPMGPPPIPVEHLQPNQGPPMPWNNAGPPPHMPPAGGGMPNLPNHRQHPQDAFEAGPMPLHNDRNPFQPNPDIANPQHFESPFYDEAAGPINRRASRPHARMRVRSPSPDESEFRTPSPRRQRSGSAKQLQQLRDKVNSLTEKFENWHVSSGSSAEADSVFSQPTGPSSTPPSSPPLSEPRGSLHRRKSHDRRPQYRTQPSGDRGYVDEYAEVRPGNSFYDRLGRPQYRREGRSRPQYPPPLPPAPMVRAVSYEDDYPAARGVRAGRYSAPWLPRRLTDYEEGGGYHPADFREEYHQLGRREQEAYERGRREGASYGRRRDSMMERGDYYC
ncbi:hypothetical protein KC332_g16722 [Hortaea werneckii]|nr:hypothetical protein KC350_g15897 [Hortaea werneckii]KAI6818246.1 hypothetical protein KC358_g10084 [Hortaea werneckii]KAI6901403.1 hypothetical protein KC348_g16489 [Hortaea werneckii]KAI6921929.1 hypothetical protein KC341_g15673 [Hortaea werneckii]KAI6954788.1 hypothetical protein KC321_g16148 [Hortaea werneckii]